MRASFRQPGFTLIEMLVTLSILAIVSGMVALFIRVPMQDYANSAARADVNGTANALLTRMTRELRAALPNSVRVQNATGGSCNGATDTCYLEFLPVLGSGRYRAAQDCSVSGVCVGDVLNIGSADTSFDVLSPMPAFAAGDLIVVDNLGTPANSAYAATDSASWLSNTASGVSISSTTFPAASPNNSFYVVGTPVSFVCVPATSSASGTLTRYWGYSIQSTQPVVPIAGASGALLAGNIGTCNFTAPLTGSTAHGMVGLRITLTEGAESASLYNEVSVGNVP
jgi:MSHA biogenesis protein MshO